MPSPEPWEAGPPEDRFDEAAPVAEPDPQTQTRTRVEADWATGDHVEMGSRLLDHVEECGRRALIFTAGTFWTYEEKTGVWVEVDQEATLGVIVQSFSGGRVKAADGKTRPLKVKSSDVRGAIDMASQRRKRGDDFFNDIPAGLAFSNGFVRVTAAGHNLEAFSPDHRSRHCYPFPFSPTHNVAPWLKFLAGLYRDDDDAAEKIAFVQEFFGACLLGLAPKYQKALFCTGRGRNGKSTLFEILRSLFPPGSVSEIAPHSLRNDYARAALSGKLLNLVTETSSRELLDTESVKALITGDALQARHPYGRMFTLIPRAGHAYAPQELPDVADTSEGFWRRPVVLEHRRQFTPSDEEKGIAQRLIVECRPAIAYWLIEGAHRLIVNGEYTIPSSHFEILNRWRKGGNNVALFAEDELIFGPESQDWTPASSLYESYRKWVAANGYRAGSSVTFGKRLVELGVRWKRTNSGAQYAAKVKGIYDRETHR